ncbi:MAG: hypothetical protein HY925_08090 [Elusimicrobia bacterium]|nr:hypothetical protein [Elusimicrobiota bacterium]
MRAVKILFVVFVVFLMFACAGAAAIYVQLNAIVKKGVETMGPLVTHTTVRVKSAGISPFTGRGRLKGFVIGNPEGFSADTSLGLRDVQVNLDMASLTEPVVVIHEIIVDAPIVIYETGPRGSNLQALKDSIASFMPPSSVEKKVEIGLFVVKRAKVRANLAEAGEREKLGTLSLPTVVVADIGRGKGATSKEAVAAMFGGLIDSVERTVAEAKAKKSGGAPPEDAAKAESGTGGLIRGVAESVLNAVAPWLPIVKRAREMIGR